MENNHSKDGQDSNNPMATWMKAASGYWETMLSTWSQTLAAVSEPNGSTADKSTHAKTSFDTTMKAMGQFSSVVSEPDSMESLFKGAGAMPQLLANAAQTGLNGLMQLQQKWFERAGQLGKSTKAFQFENLDENAFRAWTDIYEKEFSRLFNIPQLGLTRFYQEKINQAMDKYNIFQTALAEFQRLLNLPITQSLTVMQVKLGEMAKEKPLPEDSKFYYQMWVKTLEGHYMTLFQSPEYIHTLGQTLNAMSEFSQAKNDVIQDMMAMLPVPTEKEIDELYREIYLLKKRIKILEK